MGYYPIQARWGIQIPMQYWDVFNKFQLTYHVHIKLKTPK